MIIRRLLMIIFVFITFFITFTMVSYAWSNNTYIYSQDIIGKSRKSYFASGTGTSGDPLIISEVEHFFNLAYLQNLGYFNNASAPYYFEVADSNGDPITIDFSSALEIYQTLLPPVGTTEKPFIGFFEGNDSIIKDVTINGDGLQDIGVFGYLGTGATVQNLFIQEPTIWSHPTTSDDKTYFHPHNDDIENRATGYIVGHLGTGVTLSHVYVVDPTIDSSPNADLNRSEYGLVGYNEFDGGLIPGSPRDAYDFDLDSGSAKAALNYAYSTYGSTYVNGSTTRLSDVLTAVGGLISGYSLSTLKIPDPNSSAAPAPLGTDGLIYLYDQLVADGYTIGANGSEYSRENIDVVGNISFTTNYYQIFENIGATGFRSPYVDSEFNANDYPNAIFLYVKPSNNLSDLGNVTGIYGGGGQLSYMASYDSSGNYVEDRYWKNSQDLNLVSFGNSGATRVLSANNAFTAIQFGDIDPVTGEPVLTVVDETEIPDYYVFLIGVSNGQITVEDINFYYTPQSATAEDFASLGDIDYITLDQISDIITSPELYEYSNFYFNYDITFNQTIDVYTEKVLCTTGDSCYVVGEENYYFNLWIDYNITDSSIFYLDIYNINNSVINIYVNSTFDSDNPYALIEIQFSSSNYVISVP